MNKPKAVKPGDTLGLVGPSGAIRTDDGLERAIKVLKDFGYNVKVGASAGARYGYLSGTDELRAKDLNDMFMDDEVDAIICTKGGYGTPRILDRLDFDAAKKHPKLFLGYSDITALLLAYGKYADLVTFHGPMPSSCMSNGDFDEYSKAHFLKAISSTEPLGEMRNCACQKLNCLNAGQVRAPMVGGNLSLVEETLGTPYEVDCRGKILFLEDVGERPYRLDRNLTSLALAGKFRDCAGIILGTFTDCEEPPHDDPSDSGVIADSTLTLQQIIEEVILPYKKPTLLNYRAGHMYPQSTLPMGAEISIDLTQKRILLP